MSVATSGRSMTAVFPRSVAWGVATFLVVALLLTSSLPVVASLAIVFLFAGPHNYVEARYFLSRLPARMGKLRGFFLVSTFGVLGLSITLPLAFRAPLEWGWSPQLVVWTVGGWNTALILWGTWLFHRRSQQPPRKAWPYAWPVGFGLVGMSWLQPFAVPVILVFLHPLIGLWILDLEIARSRPEWRRGYHRALWALPLLVLFQWIGPLTGLCYPEGDFVPDALRQLVEQHVGGLYLASLNVNRLIATHAFLELVHYAVWIVAVPTVSGRVFREAFSMAPLMKRSPCMRRIVSAMLVTLAVIVVALWMAFSWDYASTRSVYFTFATLHVLAEVPFLLRLM